mgnify:CR=1 FL=1
MKTLQKIKKISPAEIKLKNYTMKKHKAIKVFPDNSALPLSPELQTPDRRVKSMSSINDEERLFEDSKQSVKALINKKFSTQSIEVTHTNGDQTPIAIIPQNKISPFRSLSNKSLEKSLSIKTEHLDDEINSNKAAGSDEALKDSPEAPLKDGDLKEEMKEKMPKDIKVNVSEDQFSLDITSPSFIRKNGQCRSSTFKKSLVRPSVEDFLDDGVTSSMIRSSENPLPNKTSITQHKEEAN